MPGGVNGFTFAAIKDNKRTLEKRSRREDVETYRNFPEVAYKVEMALVCCCYWLRMS
jgi:hypothetical protein